MMGERRDECDTHPCMTQHTASWGMHRRAGRPCCQVMVEYPMGWRVLPECLVTGCPSVLGDFPFSVLVQNSASGQQVALFYTPVIPQKKVRGNACSTAWSMQYKHT